MLSPSFKNILYILTILECIEKLKIYAGPHKHFDSFLKADDQMAFNASCHLLLAIGEEASKIEEDLKDEFSFIEWNQITGIRNRIAHDYRGIDPEIVFQVIVNELDILRDVMRRMLVITRISQEDLKKILETQFYPHLNYLIKEN